MCLCLIDGCSGAVRLVVVRSEKGVDAHVQVTPARCSLLELHIPNGEDTASLSEARLLLDTTNSLLENG